MTDLFVRPDVRGFLDMLKAMPGPLRKVIPSSVGDVAGVMVALKAVIVEAEAHRVMVQAAA